MPNRKQSYSHLSTLIGTKNSVVKVIHPRMRFNHVVNTLFSLVWICMSWCNYLMKMFNVKTIDCQIINNYYLNFTSPQKVSIKSEGKRFVKCDPFPDTISKQAKREMCKVREVMDNFFIWPTTNLHQRLGQVPKD